MSEDAFLRIAMELRQGWGLWEFEPMMRVGAVSLAARLDYANS